MDMKRVCLLLLMVVGAVGAWCQASTFWLGADISGTTELEAKGVQIYNAKGEPRENTALMKELGMNMIRLRVWVNPKDGFSSKEDVLVMAKRAKELGMAIMIDFHYSDWWADPGKQNIPQAWKDYNYEQMKQALARHTRETLQLLKANGIDVKWVQVGNETTNGFLWPMGRAQEHMDQYAGLTDAGYAAVKEVYPQATVIVHLDCACDPHRYDFIFDGLRKYGARFDMIGVSVYPYWDMDSKLVNDWHETVEKFAANLRRISQKYGVETMVVETGVEAKKPVEGKVILKEIINAAKHHTDGHCLGVIYWAPELEGQYPLGAFENHRPTVIMEAFTEAAAEKE